MERKQSATLSMLIQYKVAHVRSIRGTRLGNCAMEVRHSQIFAKVGNGRQGHHVFPTSAHQLSIVVDPLGLGRPNPHALSFMFQRHDRQLNNVRVGIELLTGV